MAKKFSELTAKNNEYIFEVGNIKDNSQEVICDNDSEKGDKL